MKTVLYIRVSSKEQNTARQEAQLAEWAKRTGSKELVTITEKVSGSVPAKDRQLNRVFSIGDVKRVVVQDIDRLGRDTIDVLQTVKRFTAAGITLTVTGIGLDTLLPDGRENESFKIVLSVMATLAEMERTKIRERQRQGIKEAQKRGAYKDVGKEKGYGMSRAEYLAKYKAVVKELEAGESIRRAAKLCDVSVGTAAKVSKAMQGKY